MGHGPRGYPRTWQRPLIQPEGQRPWTMSLFSGYSVVALVSLKGAPWCTWVSGLSGDSHLTLGTLAAPTLPGCAQPSSWPTLGTSLAQLPWSSQMGLRSKSNCYLKKKNPFTSLAPLTLLLSSIFIQQVGEREGMSWI